MSTASITMKTIKARRANHAEPTGKHWTLTRVENHPDKKFGFAVSDAGDEAYIPSPVVGKEQMTSADVGAGFTANVRSTKGGYSNEGAHPHIMLPVKWDGALEDVEVDEDIAEPEPLVSDEDLAELGDKLADAQTAMVNLTAAIEPMFGMAPGLKGKADLAKAEISAFRLLFNELFPENE